MSHRRLLCHSVVACLAHSAIVGGTLALAIFAIADTPAQAADIVEFNRDIRPIMADTCFKCHGPGTQEADLRLDERELALQKTAGGVTPIVPGNAAESEIIRRVFSDDEAEVMPPADSHRVLTAEQKTLLKTWVEQGAVYQRHWAFEPPVQHAVPQVDEASRIRTPIDAFLAARLQRQQLSMRGEADRETLIRRVAFALTGLPPTLAEIDRFLADTTPTAYESMVERYLTSPRFGEEMARHWLDVARYADTHGLHLDNERQMWAYRDWVIASFNNNKPFDQFTIEQIAGDLLPDATAEQLVGTGFIRCNVTTGEGGSINEEWIYRNALDRTTTTAEAFMGLTAGCAVCHDHKFDPLSSKEFYSLYAFFHSAADPPLDGNALLTQPVVKLVSAEQQQQLAELDSQIAQAQQQLDDEAAQLVYVDPASLDPPPQAQSHEQLWFDDDLPSGARVAASPGHPTQLVSADQGAQVLSGTKSLKRLDPGLAQDVFENLQDLTIPPAGRLFAHVFIEADNQPRSLMLQYFKGGWNHRAVWGDVDAIAWGQAGTPSRVHVGPLPAAGQWTRLEIDAETLGLAAGDSVTGFALTQFGGAVYWDKIGVEGRSDPAADPRRSLLAWWKQQTGKDTPGAPAELGAVIKAGPENQPADDVLAKLRAYYLQHVCAETQAQLQPLVARVAAIKQQREQLDGSIPSTFIYRDLESPRESFVMLRGQYDAPGEKVQPDVPSFLPPLQRAGDGRATRLDLARWLVAPEHPLTARVAVNRFWQQFYGTGLVKTSFDFGSQGEVPTHPELLDWLAINFRDSGWNVKSLVRMLVTSAAFRQSSESTAELRQIDPENRLYARGPRFRLGAEQIRDNALFASGLIDLSMGGRGTRPYQPPNIWEPVGFVGSNTANYTQDTGSALYRRSIYTFLKRTAPPPFMVNFDAPSREAFCSARERSNTPLQALQLMNDVQHIEAARVLAQRMMTQGGQTPQQRINFAFRVLLSRTASPAEIEVIDEVLQKQIARYQQDPVAAGELIRNGQSPLLAELPPEELAAYTLVANLLLNLDETITRN